jgi:hypothetical protein
LEDDKRFNAYLKKKFPKSFKYLPIIKLVTFMFIFITLKMDYQTYSVLSSTITDEESLNLTSTKFYSQYCFSFYIIIIVYEYVLSIYVILNANHPSLEGLSETSDDDKSTNHAIKDSPIRRHKSEPLPQRGSKRPAIRRRNMR